MRQHISGGMPARMYRRHRRPAQYVSSSSPAAPNKLARASKTISEFLESLSVRAGGQGHRSARLNRNARWMQRFLPAIRPKNHEIACKSSHTWQQERKVAALLAAQARRYHRAAGARAVEHSQMPCAPHALGGERGACGDESGSHRSHRLPGGVGVSAARRYLTRLFQ